VICLDAAMAQLLSSHYLQGSDALPATVIPNWEPAERFATAGLAQRWVLGERLESESRLCVLHVGNTGYGHSFETIVEASEQLREDPVAFVFIGGGERWSWLEAAKRERALAHWYLIRYLSEGQLKAAMASAGCALITLRDSFLGIISPSKLHAALAMALPILYVGPEGSNVDEAIRRFDCGVSLRHGNAEGVVDFIRRLRSDADYAGGLRQRAREAFERGFSDQQSLPALDRVIEGLAG
jgi:glycosyltransferase involved in cell wall biosynthesis